jgi:KDO2-lipid IV(A) lauroyltransferase
MAQRRLVREVSPVSAGALWTLLRALPPRWASRAMGRLARVVGPRVLRFRNMKENLRAAFPERAEDEVDRLARGVCENIGRVVGELAHLDDIGFGRRAAAVTYAGEEHLAPALDRPAVFVGAHTSNWEVNAFLFGRLPRPVYVVYSTVGHALIDRLILRARTETGCIYVEKAKAVRMVMEAMGKGHCVAMLVDQRVASGLEVDFFGRPTVVTNLPARLAIRFSCPIIPVETQRLASARFLVTCHPPLLADGRLPLDEQARDLTQRMSTVIEEMIRRDPSAWFCAKRRWKKARVSAAPDRQHGL